MHETRAALRCTDGLLYVPVGAPCNVCARNDRRYAAILRMRPDGSALEIFVEGWLQGRRAWGRPVDVVMTPDGDLLASDDRAGVIYRITYAP